MTTPSEQTHATLDAILEVSDDWTHECYQDEFIARLDEHPPLVVATAMLERWTELVDQNVWWDCYLKRLIRQTEPKTALREPVRTVWATSAAVHRDHFHEAFCPLGNEPWFVEDMAEVLCGSSAKRNKRLFEDTAFVLTFCGPGGAVTLIRRAKLDRALKKLPTWHGMVISRLAEVAGPGAWPTVLLATLQQVYDAWPASDVAAVVDAAALPWLYLFAQAPSLTNDMATAAGAIDTDEARALLKKWPKPDRDNGPFRPDLTEEQRAELIALEDEFVTGQLATLSS